jgi:GNAT superfamily N-acetyltransferase
VTPALNLRSLADCPGLVTPLAAWHVEAFGAWIPGWTLAEAQAELRTHDHPDRTPCTWVAWRAEQPVGSISLLLEDPPAPAALRPWLASLYVRPEYRRLGVGQRLHDHCLVEAARRGWLRVHAWAPDPAWYLRRGWQPAGILPVNGGTATLLVRGTD